MRATKDDGQNSRDGGCVIHDPQALIQRFAFDGAALERYNEYIANLKSAFAKRFAGLEDVLLGSEDRELLLKLFQYHMNNVGNPDGHCRYGLCTRGFELKLLNALFNYLVLKPYGQGASREDGEGVANSQHETFGYFTLGEKESFIWAMRTAKAMFKGEALVILPSTYSSNYLYQAAELLAVPTLEPFDLDQDLDERLEGRSKACVMMCIHLNPNLSREEYRGLRQVIKAFRKKVSMSFVHLSCSSAHDLLRFGEGYPLLEPEAHKYYVYPPMPHHLKHDASGGFYLDTISISNSSDASSSFKSGVLISTCRHKALFNEEKVSYINADDSTVVGSSNGDFILIDDYFYTRFPLTSIEHLKSLDLQGLREAFCSRQMSAYQRETLVDFLDYVGEVQPDALGYPVNQLWDDRCLSELFLILIKEKLILNTENDQILSDFSMIACRDDSGSSYVEGFIEDVIGFYREFLFPHSGSDMNGYVTTGGTEGNDVGLFLAKKTLGSDAVLFATQESHYSIKKAAKIFDLPICWVQTEHQGVMSVHDLAYKLSVLKGERRAQGRDLKPVVNVNLGTTFKGAVDPLGAVVQALKDQHFLECDYWIHGDAALQGHMLPFLKNAQQVLPFMRPTIDPEHAPIHSISLSAHKFLGSPVPCGVVLYAKKASAMALRASSLESRPKKDRHDGDIDRDEWCDDYFRHVGTITSGTPNGYMSVVIWKRLSEWGHEGLRCFSLNCLAIAQEAELQLRKVQRQTGVQVFRHDHSNILLLSPAPSDHILDKYGLPTEGSGEASTSHFVVMPHVSIEKVQALIADMIQHPVECRVSE